MMKNRDLMKNGYNQRTLPWCKHEKTMWILYLKCISAFVWKFKKKNIITIIAGTLNKKRTKLNVWYTDTLPYSTGMIRYHERSCVIAAQSASQRLTRQNNCPQRCAVNRLSRANSELPIQLKLRTAEVNSKKDVILVNVVKCIVA